MKAPALLLLTLSWGAAFAQEPVSLTEARAVELALAASPRVREAEAALAASHAQAAVVAARKKPQLALDAHLAQRSSVPEFRLPQALGNKLLYPSLETTAALSLTLAHNLDLAGVLRHSLAAASEQSSSQEARARQTRLDVALAARESFWQAVAAHAFVAVAEKDLQRSERTLSDTRLLQHAGLATEADALTAQAERERARVALLVARSEARVALANLRSLLGLPEDQAVTLQPRDQLPPVPAAEEKLLAEAKASRPELVALRRQLRALQSQTSAERAAGKPDVSLLAQVDWANPNPRYFPQEARWHGSWAMTVGGSWRLYDGGETAARAARASAEAQAAQARLAETERQVALEVANNRQRLEDALALVAATATAWEAARAREEAVRDAYLAGIARLSDLLAAQAALARAEYEVQQSRINAWLAFARLQRSLGQ